MMEPRRDIAERIDARRAELVSRIVQRHFDAHPDLDARYGTQGRARCAEDAEFHLNYLAEAIRAGSAALFVDYVLWARELLESRRIPASDLDDNLAIMQQCIVDLVPGAAATLSAEVITAAREALGAGAPGAGATASELTRKYLALLLDGDRLGAEDLLAAEITGGMPLREVYLDVLQAAQHELGRMWQRNQISVAQEHMCTAATDRIMSGLFARMGPFAPRRRSVVVTSASLEQHALGARMLADFFEMDGWDVHYLGANTPAGSAVEIVRDRQAAVLAISATMTYHIPHVRDLIIRVRARRDLAAVKILVGGYPFNLDESLWRSVGADGYARDAHAAVTEAERLAGKPGPGTR